MPLSADRQRDESITPRQWVARLNGRDLAPPSSGPSSGVQVAMFRFPGLPERLVLPPLDAHYISFTLAGSLVIERDLDASLSGPGSAPACR